MRQIKTLLALSIALVAFAAAATTASAQTPFVEIVSADGYPDSFTISGTVNTNGEAAEVWVNYFPIVLTTDCTAAPHPDDQMNSQQSAAVPLVAAEGYRPVSVDVTGLPNESDYCYQLVVRDAENDEAMTYMWSVDTTAPAPDLANSIYDAGTNSVAYQVDITPNTNLYIAYVAAEYFAKGAESCDDHTGSTNNADYWGEDWNGFQGFGAQTVGTTISGLSTDTTYCFRLKSNNGHGEATPTAWQEVTTISPIAASISDVRLVPPSGADDANLKLTLNDNGAETAEAIANEYEVYLYDVGAGRCNSQDYFGGDMIVGWGGEFGGEMEFDAGVNGLELGKPYCVTVFVESAWGDTYDATVHEEVWFGAEPSATLSGADVTHNSITMVDADIYPGHLATEYGLEYFEKQTGVACYDDNDTPRSFVSSGTLTEDLDQTQTFDFSADVFDPETTYCVRIKVTNYWGTNFSSMTALTTTKEPVKATIVDLAFGPPSIAERDVEISATVDEFGAAAATAGLSTWQIKHYELPQSSCNSAGVSGQTALATQTESFNGQKEVEWNLDPTDPGDQICVELNVDSAWAGMDEVAFLWLVVPQKPVLSNLALTSSKTSVTAQASIEGTWTSTGYWIESYPAVGEDCDTMGSVTTGNPIDFSPNTAAGTISATQSGLSPDTLYCARLRSSNQWGVAGTPYETVRTVEATAPSVPTGLSASNVTQTSATLSWDASTDSAGVAAYRVLEGANTVATGAATSFAVSLTCGQSRTFTVIAIDVNDNESGASAPFTVTAAACPTPPTSPPASPPAPAQTCLVGFKKFTISGKLKGRKGAKANYKVTVSSKLSPDRKSLAVVMAAKNISAKKIKIKLNGTTIKISTKVTSAGKIQFYSPTSTKIFAKQIGVTPC